MIKITQLEPISGLATVLKKLRVPFKLQERSHLKCSESYGEGQFESRVDISFEPKDLALLKALVSRGDEHAKKHTYPPRSANMRQDRPSARISQRAEINRID
jgi:hypothetical protein